MNQTSVYKLFNGTSGEYRALHNWVQRRLGKPIECENCGSNDKSIYHWANISGEYLKDTSDWARLCGRCHALFDGRKGPGSEKKGYREYCKHNHKLEEVGIYMSRITSECMECRREQRSKNRAKNKLVAK